MFTFVYCLIASLVLVTSGAFLFGKAIITPWGFAAVILMSTIVGLWIRVLQHVPLMPNN